MANSSLIPFDAKAGTFSLPGAFGPIDPNDFDALTNGVSIGYGVLSFRGKVWRVRYNGAEAILRDKQGQPLRKLNCVIVGTNPALSKTFYEGAYEPGSNNPPDCSSMDGIRPDTGVPNPQSISCATCHNNQFGSKVSDAGKKLKACTDGRRLAVVPYPDIANEAHGGVMLLRVPPASLKSLADTVQVLRNNMVPPHAAVIEVSFDLEAEYPLLTFTPRAAIADNTMAAAIMDCRRSDAARQILHGAQTVLPLSDALALPAATPVKQAAVAAPAKPRKPKAETTAEPSVPVAATDDLADLMGGDEKAPIIEVKPTGRRVESKPVEAEPMLDDDDDDDLSDVLAGLDA